jgi:hypothetical protein
MKESRENSSGGKITSDYGDMTQHENNLFCLFLFIDNQKNKLNRRGRNMLLTCFFQNQKNKLTIILFKKKGGGGNEEKPVVDLGRIRCNWILFN